MGEDGWIVAVRGEGLGSAWGRGRETHFLGSMALVGQSAGGGTGGEKWGGGVEE